MHLKREKLSIKREKTVFKSTFELRERKYEKKIKLNGRKYLKVTQETQFWKKKLLKEEYLKKNQF